MYIIHDGFDAYGPNQTVSVPNKWSRAANDAGANIVFPGHSRFGVGSSIGLANGKELQKDLATNTTELIVGGAFGTYFTAAMKTALVSFYDGATRQCTITAESNGSLALRSGGFTGTILAQTAAGLFAFNTGIATMTGLSFRVKFHSTAGEFQVYYEGASVLSVNSLNTRSSSNDYVTMFALGASDGNSGFYATVDDFYAFDTTGATHNAFPGDVRVFTSMPTGAGASTDLTPNTGANWEAMDEALANEDVDYVASSTVGHKDLYALADLPGTFAGSILALGVNLRARKDDAGLRQVAATIRSNSVDADGGTVSLAGNYFTYWDVWLTDPSGGAAFTTARANALQAGLKVVA